METFTFLYRVFVNEAPEFSENKLRHIFMICLGKDVSQYIREAYVHKERKGHPQLAWKLQETVSIL